MRSYRSMVTFSNAFTLSDYPDELPAGEYEVVIEEELLEGLSFEAWRRTAAYLTVRGTGSQKGRTEMRPISDSNLREALARDSAVNLNTYDSDAALSPQEDLK